MSEGTERLAVALGQPVEVYGPAHVVTGTADCAVWKSLSGVVELVAMQYHDGEVKMNLYKNGQLAWSKSVQAGGLHAVVLMSADVLRDQGASLAPLNGHGRRA